MKFLRLLGLGLMGVVLIVAAGCGSTEHAGRVSGTVRSGVTPLPGGTVLFESGDKLCSGAIENGRFELSHDDGPNIPPGMYRVSVSPPPTELIADPATTQLRAATPIDETLYPVSARNPDSFGLSLEVKAGANTFQIDVARGAGS